MSFKSKLISVLAAISAGCLPLAAQASALTVVNNTDHDSTTVTNGFMCSSKLPGGNGITRAHTTNVISENTINIACLRNKENCKADVYMSNNCSGPIVATVIFSTKSGIKDVAMKSNTYHITAQGFYIQMDPASAA